MRITPILLSASAIVLALLRGVGEFAALQRWRLQEWLQHAR